MPPANGKMQTNSELESFLMGLGDRGMSSEGLNMIESYIRACWDKGVEVVLDYSMTEAFGTYDPSTNILTIGGPALECNTELVETIEHEFIHVLQDQLDGLENSLMTPLGLPINANGFVQVAANYAHLDPAQQALELEAHSAESMIQAGHPSMQRCCDPLEQQLVAGYVANGMDPIEASIQATVQAPLIESLLA